MKKQNRKLTVTIGIPAYNEEANIGNLLNSLLVQKKERISIEKIIVVSDGSTDSTVKKVKLFTDRRIHCIAGEKRLGKPSRLNQLFSLVTSDVLVIIDADMICKDKFTIENLIIKFKKKKRVGLVTGNTQPVAGKTFIERAVNNYIYARNSVQHMFDFGKTGYSTHAFLAYSKEFLRNFRIPADILNDDAYSYFLCNKSEWNHVYAKNAVALNRSPGSIKDYSGQIIRYMRGGEQLYKYFGEEYVSSSIKLPLGIYIRIFVYQLLHNPIGYIVLKTAFYYSLLCFRLSKQEYEVRWSAVTTSKVII